MFCLIGKSRSLILINLVLFSHVFTADSAEETTPPGLIDASSSLPPHLHLGAASTASKLSRFSP